MKKIFDIVRDKRETQSFICQAVEQEGEFSVAYVAQFTIKSSRGKRSSMEIDFENQTVKSKNKLFKVVDCSFSINKYREWQ